MIKLLRAVAFSVCLLGPIFSVAQADELTTPSSSKATAMSALVAQLIRGKPSAPHSPIIKGANILESACGGYNDACLGRAGGKCMRQHTVGGACEFCQSCGPKCPQDNGC